MENDHENFPESEEVNLIQYVNVLLKRRWMIIAGVFFCVVFAAIYSFKLSPFYTASAKFLLSKNPEMTSRMGSLLGGGNIQSFSENVTSEYYTELLKSTPFLERILARTFFSRESGGEVDLAAYYEIEAGNEIEKRELAIKAVRGNLEISTARTTQVITLSYTTGESELSAAIVNAFLDELSIYNQDIRSSKATENRVFVEKQLKDVQKLLNEAEDRHASFLAKNKKVGPDLQPELDRLVRSVKVQEEVYITLSKQLELAKIEEQEKKPMMEILESAAPPLTRSGPSRKKNVILAGFVSLMLFVGLAFVLEFLSKINRKDEKYTEFFQNLEAVKNDFKRLLPPYKRK